MANLTNSSNIIDEINSKLTNPDGWSNGQVLTKTDGGAEWKDLELPETIWDVKYSDFNFVQLSWSSVELSISSAIEPTSNFTIKAPAELKEWIVYTLRVKNWNTAYTMTLGEWITNPWDTDVTLTPNAIDQFVFLAVDWVLELQPEAGGGGWWESPNTVKLFTMPSEWDNISGIVEHLTNWGQIVLQDEFDIYQSTFFEEWTITVSLVWVNSITNININYDWSNVVESITVIDSDIGPRSEVVEEAPAEYVAGKVYFIVDGGVTLKTYEELIAYTDAYLLRDELNSHPKEYYDKLNSEWHIKISARWDGALANNWSYVMVAYRYPVYDISENEWFMSITSPDAP